MKIRQIKVPKVRIANIAFLFTFIKSYCETVEHKNILKIMKIRQIQFPKVRIACTIYDYSDLRFSACET